ncbi:MAG: DNA repair protein RadC, partial [Chloroflexi bacterium]|nr:DNA repair protein RadC [Chloroflexota bacterium]
AKFEGLVGLARTSLAELCTVKGLGVAKAAQLQAAFELGRRLSVAAPHEKPQISSPADAANLVMLEMSRLEQEQLRVLLLDTRNRVLSTATIYQGSLNSSLVRIGELFREAIRHNCAALIIVHNHPSGDPAPSVEDVNLTRQAVQAGKLLNIEVLDHIVIGQQRFVSLKERKLGFR